MLLLTFIAIMRYCSKKGDVMIPTNSEILDKIYNFCQKYKMSQTMFGLKAKKDPCLVSRIKNGQDIRESGKRRILDFMYNYEAEEKSE